ncbi:RDD family protein [Sinomicrobium weinanense]|uniref:RDD family protein n=1 Tax=Sinomicrobium weinanense TaxID=2842200 RepID=A0A926JSR4_9FLAO|nr:RDD family protein [Sinomicrobium weinanense]MBC9796572.1 RDD family protein [Sinomicrobium weinanense]MBU3123556.1 RDD family protein [Sinomicrobium weinanense]
MAELQINTTQNVNISFTAASVGERILAYFVDMLIKVAYVVVVYQILFRALAFNRFLSGMDRWSEIAVMLIFFLPFMFYTLLFESLLEGQTPGKRLLRIKVVKIDGYQASFPDYLVRWFLRIVDINMLGGVVALISIIMSNKSQRLGDMTAGTSVISLKNKVTIDHTILENLQEDYQPIYPTVIRLSDNDARIIKETFLSAKKSGDKAIMNKLKSKIEEVIQSKAEEPDVNAFIDRILKDYNYFTQKM